MASTVEFYDVQFGVLPSGALATLLR